MCHCTNPFQSVFCISDGAVEVKVQGVWSGCHVQVCGGKLVGERTRRPLRVKVTELMFADDVAAIGSDRVSMECAAAELERVIKD